MSIPEPRRPSLSGYIQAERKLLPWKWVDARMARASNYWVVTRSPGFPCARPVWGLWWSPRFSFSTGGALARHIARDPRVQVHLESADELVILEGLAGRDPSADEQARWMREYAEKYNWDAPPPAEEMILVRPTRVLAWVCDPTGLDGGTGFLNSATEWRFE